MKTALLVLLLLPFILAGGPVIPDIKVVMAVGDSMSAGFAMYSPHATNFNNFSSMLVEYRGDVFSIGGDDGYYTLPNFLKKYNPSLQGPSIGDSLPLDYVKWRNHVVQTTYNKSVDFNNDWKMLTILIGANNLCGACHNASYSLPDFYQQQLEIVLEKTYTQIPRVFVNVLLMFNISQVYTAMMTSEYCKLAVNYITTTECGCLTDHTTPQEREAMDVTGVAYNQKIYELEEVWASKNLTNFAVRVQPFLQNLPIAEAGVDFLSKLDCFGLANGAMAVGYHLHPVNYISIDLPLTLWNNLWQPKGQKDATIPFNITFVCPTANSYIQ